MEYRDFVDRAKIDANLYSAVEEQEPKTLGDRAYRELRRRILEGAFPAGQKLRVEHLRDELGLGATPLREALSRLSAERLVEQEGQRGFRVAPMSLGDLVDITENRVLLETRAVELSVQRGDVEWEAALLAAHHLVARVDKNLRTKDFDIAEREALNTGFHDALMAACDSRWLLEMCRVMYDQHARYRAMALGIIQKRGTLRDVEAEHEAIVKAALARQHKRAASLVEEHVRATATLLEATLADHLAA